MKVTQNKAKTVIVRVTEDEFKLLKMASMSMDMDVSQMVRMAFKPMLIQMKTTVKNEGKTIDEAYTDFLARLN